MEVIARNDARFDEAKFIIVDRHNFMSVNTMLSNVMCYLYDNSPVQAAFHLQKIQDIITDYQQQNRRLFTFGEDEMAPVFSEEEEA